MTFLKMFHLYFLIYYICRFVSQFVAAGPIMIGMIFKKISREYRKQPCYVSSDTCTGYMGKQILSFDNSISVALLCDDTFKNDVPSYGCCQMGMVVPGGRGHSQNYRLNKFKHPSLHKNKQQKMGIYFLNILSSVLITITKISFGLKWMYVYVCSK